MTNLVELIDKNDEDIDFYLSDITVENFKLDIKQLIKELSNKGLIDLMIKQLEKLK